MNNSNENTNDYCATSAKENDAAKHVNDTADCAKSELDESSLEQVVGGFAPKRSFQSGVPLPRLDQF